MTLRGLMVVVALVGVGLGVPIAIHRQRDRYRSLVSHHTTLALIYAERGLMIDMNARLKVGDGAWWGPSLVPETAPWIALSEYHEALKRKYERAAGRPWALIPPDPPPPFDEPINPFTRFPGRPPGLALQ
jgi:hypothetical protein